MKYARFLSAALLISALSITALGIHAQDAAPVATAEASATAAQPFTLINLNDTNSEALMAIPGMTDRMTDEFGEYAPYISILQFRQEIGKYVDEAQVAAYEQYIYVPVQANDSDSDTLQQIPGVTADIADKLIAARPYADANAFVDALGQYLTPAQVEYGANYVEGYVKPADASATAEPTAEAAVQAFTLLNLNNVTSDQLLAAIPDMSNRMTREFAEYVPYVSILQFRQEIGKYVGEDQVKVYEQYVYVPVQINDADSETLQQIPGVTADIADKLIAARPYADNAAFLTALGQYVTPDQAAYAANYLEAK